MSDVVTPVRDDSVALVSIDTLDPERTEIAGEPVWWCTLCMRVGDQEILFTEDIRESEMAKYEGVAP